MEGGWQVLEKFKRTVSDVIVEPVYTGFELKCVVRPTTVNV